MQSFSQNNQSKCGTLPQMKSFCYSFPDDYVFIRSCFVLPMKDERTRAKLATMTVHDFKGFSTVRIVKRTFAGSSNQTLVDCVAQTSLLQGFYQPFLHGQYSGVLIQSISNPTKRIHWQHNVRAFFPQRAQNRTRHATLPFQTT